MAGCQAKFAQLACMDAAQLHLCYTCPCPHLEPEHHDIGHMGPCSCQSHHASCQLHAFPCCIYYYTVQCDALLFLLLPACITCNVMMLVLVPFSPLRDELMARFAGLQRVEMGSLGASRSCFSLAPYQYAGQMPAKPGRIFCSCIAISNMFLGLGWHALCACQLEQVKRCARPSPPTCWIQP